MIPPTNWLASLSSSAFCLLPPGMAVDRLLPAGNHLVLETHATSPSAPCPLCDQFSSRRHSTYRRRLADLPWQGRTVELHLRIRRFRCTNTTCPRRLFAERLPEVTVPKARRTIRLRILQQEIGLALGGEQGSWLAGRLAMPLSPATLLRLIRAIDLKPPGTPRVIGVDDWAFRRGQHYGTIICDLEQPRTLALLPDRQAETLEAWLKAHPSVEVVARDRAGAYADGIRKGAPTAIQVADRFHLLCNGSDALKAVFDRKRREVRRAFEAAAHAAGPAPSPEPPPAPVTRADDRAHDRARQRQARYEEVARLHAAGLPILRIARELGLGRKTVRRWLRAGQAPTYRKPGRPKLIDRHRDYLERRWQEGCHNGMQLWRELRDQGFTGKGGIVRIWATQRRRDLTRGPAAARRPAVPVPTSRQATRLVLADTAKLDAAERKRVATLINAAPEITEAVDVARAFGSMIRQHATDALDPWIAAARCSELRGFADSIARDHAAVAAALRLPWSTGPVEGRINKLKLVKRQMYGRANFDLLRQRVLAAA
ncbi:MAG TPA: ISL3 family transposase [Acetobacteraceae bacterium]